MKKYLLILGLIFCFAPHAFAACGNGYSFCRTVTTDHTLAGSATTANFAMAISGTYSYLATVGNGGKVQNTTTQTGGIGGTVPADLVFTSDAACTTKLNWEFETYNSATGAVNIWVNIGTLSNVSDVVVYECYGNSSVTTWQGNVTGTWDTNYKGVWHYADNAASTAVVDSTGNTSAAAFHNTSTIASTGNIDGGFSMVAGNSDNVAVTNPVALTTNNTTVSFWFKPPSTGVADWISYFGNAPTGDGGPTLGWVNQLGSLLQYSNGGGYTTVGTMTANNWYYIVTTGNSSANTAYLNNAAGVSSGSNNGGNNTNFYVGSGFGGYTTASFDEVRISNVIRSASQILAEYNNESSPATFYTVGTEQNGTVTVVKYFLQLLLKFVLGGKLTI